MNIRDNLDSEILIADRLVRSGLSDNRQVGVNPVQAPTLDDIRIDLDSFHVNMMSMSYGWVLNMEVSKEEVHPRTPFNSSEIGKCNISHNSFIKQTCMFPTSRNHSHLGMEKQAI